MTNLTYEQAPVAVREDILAAHLRAWQRLGAPGTWLTGAERIAIMAETRTAAACGLCQRRREALSPHTIDGAHDHGGTLEDDLVEIVHRVRTDSARLTPAWFESVTSGAVTAERYVETIGVLAQTVAIDTFALGLGTAPWPLPAAQDGAPSRYRPEGVREGEAWVPLLAPEAVGEAEADLYPGGAKTAYIRRALSLVPDEVRGFFDISNCQYLPGTAIADFATAHRAITRAQIELVAGRISSLNGCVY